MADDLAHLSGDGREQTIREHLDGTAELCRGFARPSAPGSARMKKTFVPARLT